MENEVLAGTLFAENGQPAADAEIKIIPVDHVPHKGLIKRGADTVPIFTFRTDAEGRYYPKDLPPGAYNIFGNAEGSVSYLDSIAIVDSTGELPADTLSEPGSIAGTVALEPNHDPRTVFVQMLGTVNFAAADSAGGFAFRGLAAGNYPIRVVTSLNQYAQYFGMLRVRSGTADTLDTIRLVFTGIPVVRGMKIAYDTANAVARLAWSPAHYPFLKEYLIYRNDKSALTAPQTPIARIRDTIFHDSLSASAQGAWPDPGKPIPQFEYRIRVRNLSDEEGLAFGTVSVTAVPIASVKTRFTLLALGGIEGAFSVRDTLRVAVSWSNPTRGNDSILWTRKRDGKILKSGAVSGAEGVDTLVFVADSVPGRQWLGVEAKDEAGSRWSDSIGVEVLIDRPSARAGSDTLVTIKDVVNLHGSGSDGFGRIVKWEWDFGATGRFVRTSGGDTTASAGDNAGMVLNVLRVTDDDGNTALDTMRVTAILDAPMADAGADTTVTLFDVVNIHGRGSDKTGRIVKWEWDIAESRTFVKTSTGDTVVKAGKAGSFNNILRVTDDDGNTATDTMKVYVIADVPTLKIAWDSLVTISDTIHLKGTAVDSTVATLVWELDKDNSGTFVPFRGPDTFILAPATPGIIQSMVRVTDEDGNSAEVGLLTRIIIDRPFVTLLMERENPFTGGGFYFQAPVQDRGRVTWEWDIGDKGNFVAGKEKMPFKPGPSDGDSIIVTVRVSDEDGNFTVLTSRFGIDRWSYYRISQLGYSHPAQTEDRPFRPSLAGFAGTLIMSTHNRRGETGYQVVEYLHFDIGKQTISHLPEAGKPNHQVNFSWWNGNAYALGKDEYHMNSLLQATPYSSEGKSWLPGSLRAPYLTDVHQGIRGTAMVGSHIYSITALQAPVMLDFDVQREEWAAAPIPGPTGYRSMRAIAALDGKVYVISLENETLRECLLAYDPAGGGWTELGRVPDYWRWDALVGWGGKLYFLTDKLMYAYDLAGKRWTRQDNLPEPIFPNAATVMEGKIYTLCGEKGLCIYDTAMDR